MLNDIKIFFKDRLISPVSRALLPLQHILVALFTPLARVLAPVKIQFDERWAFFSADHPTLSVWLRRSGKLAIGIYALYFIFAIGLFGELPTVTALQDMQTLNTSEVYTSDSLLIGKFYKENRKDIHFDSIPKNVVNALIATEDERYWDHGGVDFRSFARVFFRSFLKGEEAGGGGSTLSQQLAKNLFGRKKYSMLSTPINKIREMLIARRLERAYDKKNLLAFYLNTVPFGGNVFGIEMAAKRFFNKTTPQLNISEGAVIVGMLKANTSFNPRRNPDRSRDRRNVVMAQMVKNNFLTKQAYDTLKLKPLKLEYQPVLNRDMMASYFKDYLRQTLPKMLETVKKDDGTPYDIFKDGLKIYTSIDGQMQKLAEEVVSERMAKLQRVFDEHWSGQKWWGEDKTLDDAMRNSDRWKHLSAEGYSPAKIRVNFLNSKINMTIFAWDKNKPGEDERVLSPMDSIKYYLRQLNTGFEVMDPRNGLIKVWVGGTDFNFFQYDHVRSHRQVGSTFKPIVYARAIQSGIPPCEYISNHLKAYMNDGRVREAWQLTEEEKKDAYIPRNSGESYFGSYSLEGALTNSVNVVSVQLINKVGVKSVINLAKDMGVTTEIERNYSIALGTSEISLFDMMKVYGTFAARGKRPEPVTVLKITTRDGKVIADYTKNINPLTWQQVLTNDQSDIMTHMMKSVVNDGTGGRMRSVYELTSDIAGKTGTTQSHADGWFMCYTPNLVCGTWVGGGLPIIRFRDISEGQGAYTALPIAGMFLQRLYKMPKYAALKAEKFPEPAKWIRDSMACAHRFFSEDEILLMDSLRIVDSLREDSLHTFNHIQTGFATDTLRKSTPVQNLPTHPEDHDLGNYNFETQDVKPYIPPAKSNKPNKPDIKPVPNPPFPTKPVIKLPKNN